MTRAGYVAIVGRPNAGKSTLLNRLVGERLAITSAKPQSTRDRVVGILTDRDAQLIFLDTPGLLEPRYALHESMRAAALEALRDADVTIHLVDGSDPAPAVPLATAAGLTKPPRAPVLTAYNKVDLADPAAATADRTETQETQDRGEDGVFYISALTGAGVAELLDAVRARLPEGPFLYPEDEVSTQSVRFFVGEMIREAALDVLADEVPYAVACEVDEYREGRTPLYIRATVYVERDSQRGILIGAGGATLRRIGRTARQHIESFVGRAVYLDLWVKVLKNWRRDPRALRRFGYHLPPAGAP